MKIQFYAAIAATLLAASASAAPFSFSGSFTNDNDKAAVSFLVAAPTTVTIKSLGYAGGTAADGTTVARGGFDGILSLYDSTGTLVQDNDDGAGSTVDAVTGHGGDPLLSLTLAKGLYKVFLTQYSNFGPIDLTNAFAFDGADNRDFRGGFVDSYGSQRDGHWAFDLTGANSVPEGGTVGLLGLALAGLIARRRVAQA